MEGSARDAGWSDSREPTSLDDALGYAERGMPVFLCESIDAHGRCTCGAADCDSPGKHPARGIAPRGFHDATTERKTIEQWCERRPDANVAIRTGAESGLVVLDEDQPAGADTRAALEAQFGALPDTPRVLTGGGGVQYFFRHPGRMVPCSSGKVGLNLDVRGDGGYVIAPQSLHQSGRLYTFELGASLDDLPLAPAPPWFLERACSPAQPIRIEHAGGDEIPTGQRNDKLTRIAGALRRRGCGLDEILAALQATNAKRCRPSLSDAEVVAIARSVLRYEPEEGTERAAVQDDRPWLNAAEGDLSRSTSLAWDAVRTANKPERLFRFASLPSRIERTDENVPIPKLLTQDRLRHELARASLWFKPTAGHRKPVLPPLAVVANMLATPEPQLPILRRIVEAPIFAANGTLLLTPGYQPAGEVFYAPAPGFEVRPVPSHPSAADVRCAREWLLTELLGDFPFAGDAERAHALSLLLLAFVRELIDGPTPLFLVEKPTPGTGASLLVDVLCMPALGRSVATMTEGRDEDEWRKRLTAKLRTSPAVVCIDNLRRRLDSAAVASAITATMVEDRILGVSEMARVPVRCGWIATGNNPALSSEMTRRTVRIRLDAGMEQPWLRTDFRKPDLRAWSLAHRVELVWSALVLVQSWIAAGRPMGSATLGMFEPWARVTGGILSVADVGGFLANLNDLYGASNAEDAAWRALVDAWWSRHGGRSVRIADLFDLITAESSDINLDLGNGGDRSQRTRLGILLTRHRDRRFGSHRITAAGTEHRAQLWKLTSCA